VLLPVQQYLLLSTHIESVGLGSRAPRALLEYQPVAIVGRWSDRGPGHHNSRPACSGNPLVVAESEEEARDSSNICGRDLVSLGNMIRRAAADSASSTLIVSGIRIWKIYSYANSNNPTWDNVPGDHWSVLEANISVFCVCMVGSPDYTLWHELMWP
jgi:hypothetical protein